MISNIFWTFGPFFVIFGGTIPYIFQYLEISRQKSAAGFSLYICFILCVANILKIQFWISKRFQMTLLYSSLVMLLCMLVMLEISVRMNRQTVPLTQRKSIWNAGYVAFWQWHDLFSYICALLLFSGVIAIVTFVLYGLFKMEIYIQTLGSIPFVLEASFGWSQLLKNFNRKSTTGMRYDQEREQFLEYQRYSKELETELDLELNSYKKKLAELEGSNRRLTSELENIKKRYETERQEFLSTESTLRTKLTATENNYKDLKEKLRRVEQFNDDLERRERIQAQELVDWANRYEKCLERCAILEAGVFNGEEEMEHNGASQSPDVLTDRTNILKRSVMNSSHINTPTTITHKDMVISSLPNSNHSIEATCNGFHNVGNSSKKSPMLALSPKTKDRSSSAIVSSLFRKIEEVEKQMDPNKYIIHRTPNRK
ncbi:PQ-loop repeat-containing protein 1 [Ditylenchus destructor]|nr:PQ-loop repeat-containing protein 1 [Ditylenchus destructor]